MQKKSVKLANRTNDSVWKTLAQRWKTACICTLFKAYTAERVWKYIGDRLKVSCYLSRDDHGRRIRARKQNTDVGKYCSVNWTIKLLNQLPADTKTINCAILFFKWLYRSQQKKRKEFFLYPLNWLSDSQSNPCPKKIFWCSSLILSSQPFLCLPSLFFPSGFPSKTLYAPLPHSCYMYRPYNSSLLG